VLAECGSHVKGWHVRLGWKKWGGKGVGGRVHVWANIVGPGGVLRRVTGKAASAGKPEKMGKNLGDITSWVHRRDFMGRAGYPAGGSKGGRDLFCNCPFNRGDGTGGKGEGENPKKKNTVDSSINRDWMKPGRLKMGGWRSRVLRDLVRRGEGGGGMYL